MERVFLSLGEYSRTGEAKNTTEQHFETFLLTSENFLLCGLCIRCFFA